MVIFSRFVVSVDHLPAGVTQARLEVKEAVEADTGNYTCSPANSKPAHVSVFVNKGELGWHTLSLKWII